MATESPDTNSGPGDWKPRPDPTALTLELVRRELAALNDSITARLDAIDIATVLRARNTELEIAQLKNLHDVQFANNAVQGSERYADVRTIYDEKIASIYRSLKDYGLLSAEKFAGIDKQFTERDTRVEQTAKDTKVAVDAALQAAEKAVGKQNESFALSIAKSEAATMKQIDQQAATIQTATAGLESKIGDLKDRVGRIENQAIGWAQSENKQVTKDSSHISTGGLVIAVGGLIVTAVVAFIGAMSLVLSHVGGWK